MEQDIEPKEIVDAEIVEEVVEDVVEEVVDEVPAQLRDEIAEEAIAVEHSDVEKQAMEKGWKPEAEFSNPDRPFIGAEEFIRNEPFVQQKRELKRMLRDQEYKYKQEMRGLTNQVKESKKVGYEQALRDLDVKRTEAVEIGDVEAFSDIDSQYAAVRDNLNQTTREIDYAAPAPEMTESLLEFRDRNQEWFNENSPANVQMVGQAVQIEQHLMASKPYLTEDQRLQAVEDEIRSIHKDRFVNVQKQKPAAVVPSDKAAAPSGGQSGKIRYNSLSEDNKRKCKIFLDADPEFTFEDFVDAAQLDTRNRK